MRLTGRCSTTPMVLSHSLPSSSTKNLPKVATHPRTMRTTSLADRASRHRIPISTPRIFSHCQRMRTPGAWRWRTTFLLHAPSAVPAWLSCPCPPVQAEQQSTYASPLFSSTSQPLGHAVRQEPPSVPPFPRLLAQSQAAARRRRRRSHEGKPAAAPLHSNSLPPTQALSSSDAYPSRAHAPGQTLALAWHPPSDPCLLYMLFTSPALERWRGRGASSLRTRSALLQSRQLPSLYLLSVPAL